jgi:hypothetical protein
MLPLRLPKIMRTVRVLGKPSWMAGTGPAKTGGKAGTKIIHGHSGCRVIPGRGVAAKRNPDKPTIAAGFRVRRFIPKSGKPDFGVRAPE